MADKITSFADFEPQDVDVQINLPDERQLIVPMRIPSYAELMEVNRAVADPKPPISGIDPTTKRPLVDYNDPGYQRSVQDAYTERMFRLIAQSVRIDLPGDSQAEKVAYLRGLDPSLIGGLMAAMNQLTKQGEAQLLARAGGFHTHGTAGTEIVSANGHQPDAIPTPA